MDRNRIITNSPEETFAFGKELGEKIKAPAVLCFFGDLAAGKTTLIKGFVEGAAHFSANRVSSPTFVLLNIYEGTQNIYHFDLYRLQDEEGFLSLGFEEYLDAGLVCIEWAERIEKILPEDAIKIHMKALDEGRRQISIEGVGIGGSI